MVLDVIVDQNPIPVKKIKAEVVNTPRAHAVQERVSRSASEFSIDSIVRFVNGKDLLRYLPEESLKESSVRGVINPDLQKQVGVIFIGSSIK